MRGSGRGPTRDSLSAARRPPAVAHSFRDDPRSHAARKPAQKASLILAYASYLAALVMLLLAIYRGFTIGTDNPIFASFAASVVFFVGAGVVLHVMGAVNLPSLKINKNH